MAEMVPKINTNGSNINGEQSNEPLKIDTTDSKVEVGMKYTLNQYVEAQDDDYPGVWYESRVIKIDHKNSKVLIHFKGFNKRYDQWKSFSSQTIRAMPPAK